MLTFTNNERVRILFDMVDSDEDGNDRVTPAGSVGAISANSDDLVYSVVFDNGAAGFLYEAELLDRSLCEVLSPAPSAADVLLAALRQIAEEVSNGYPDALARIGEIAAAAVAVATATKEA